MRASRLLVLLTATVFLTACDPEPDPEPELEECSSYNSLDWENAGQPYLFNWCTPCHSSHLSGADRAGAPEGVDFDTFESLSELREAVVAVVEGDDPLMPPEGGPEETVRAEFISWLHCGAPENASGTGEDN